MTAFGNLSNDNIDCACPVTFPGPSQNNNDRLRNYVALSRDGNVLVAAKVNFVNNDGERTGAVYVFERYNTFAACKKQKKQPFALRQIILPPRDDQAAGLRFGNVLPIFTVHLRCVWGKRNSCGRAVSLSAVAFTTHRDVTKSTVPFTETLWTRQLPEKLLIINELRRPFVYQWPQIQAFIPAIQICCGCGGAARTMAADPDMSARRSRVDIFWPVFCCHPSVKDEAKRTCERA